VRGIVYTGDKAELTDELGLRDPGATEVVVRTIAAGVCHSDLSVVDGTIPWPSPSVLGHEGAGVVEEVGSAVTMVKPGDHVVVSTLASCGMCRWCNTGRPAWCRRSMGNVSQPFTFRGDPAYNFAATSSFAERTVVQQVQAVPISKDVPLESACLIACGVLTGVGAVLNRARVDPGDTAAVFGVGGVGLNVIQGLRLASASRIVAVDSVASKESLARAFGATEFVDASRTDPVAAIRELLPTGGGEGGGMATSGVDWAFECVGSEKVLASALEVLDWGGTCVAVGVPAPTAQVPVRVTHLTHVDRGLIGCRYGSSRPRHDIPLLVGLYLDGRLMLDELVSRTEPLEGFDAVVADMHDGKLARGVLTF
jgi:S-(hydroxymethyl)glutathione dehydrogenase/alcohol dehydrogenase